MTPNWLDKGVGWLAPSLGLRRMRARLALQGIEKLAYEGAKTGRRTDGWTTAGTSANAEIGASLSKLRERSRSLFRDSPVKKMLRVMVANIVGTGIRPQARTGDEKQDKVINTLFERWQMEADADDQLDFYGLQALIVRTVIESGECLIRFRPRRLSDGMETIPLQLQVIEPDYLDLSKNTATSTGYILQGVEFDKLGTRVAYWLFPEHPGEVLPTRMSGSFTSRRIPASEVLHVYVKERPGQIRGVPWLAPVLLTIRDRDDWNDAKILLKKIQSCLVAFVTQPEGPDGPTLMPSTTDATGQRIESMEPGMVRYGNPGEDVKFNNPPSGDADTEFRKSIDRDIAAGFGCTYQQMTGDLSDANYSNYRAGHIDFGLTVDEFNYLTFEPMFGRPSWRRFIDTGVLAGLLPAQEYGARWMPPKRLSIDPAKDAKADQILVRSGFATWPQIVSANGYDPDAQLNEIAEYNKKFDDKEIVLDSDARKGKGTTDAQAEGDANNNGQQKQDAA